MGSNILTEQSHEPTAATWQAPHETAPSQVHAAEPTLARWIGGVGLCLVALGASMLILYGRGRAPGIFSFFGPLFSVLGLAGLLFHCANDADLQMRRTYGIVGYACLLFGVLISVLPMRGSAGALFLPAGVPAFTLGLLFLMPFVRFETETNWRQTALLGIGAAGLFMALAGFIGGSISESFLLPYGLLLGLFGFCYLWAFAALQGTDTDLGYRAALGVGVVGALALIVAVGRSLLPPLLHSWHILGTRPAPYFVPSGLLVSGLGLLYLALSIGLTSENRVVVLTRRELAAFFYSPIAYIVLFGMSLVGWWMFYQFIVQLLPFANPLAPAALEEPILMRYFISWWSVLSVIITVPVLTMRLLSEEKRAGTLEVLLTAPVSETQIVLSKFLATLIFFLVAVLPWGLYLISFRIEGGQPFEYRPLLGFFIAVVCSGSGFLAMGLFFSSLTRNQIASALLSAVGMLAMTAVFFAEISVERSELVSRGFWAAVLKHCSYIDLWLTAMEGVIQPPLLIFHVSAAVFWLFLTVKVLEARKWV